MSPSSVVTGSRPSLLGRLPRRETRDWTAVVVQYATDDWPPPEWLAITAEHGNDPHEAPAPEKTDPLAA